MSDAAVLWLDDAVWRLGVEREGAFEWAEAEAVDRDEAEILDALLTDGEGVPSTVVVMLASSWCLCAEVSTEGVERGRRLTELGYRLEELLPVSAEEVVADYVASNGRALGVCVVSRRVRGVLDALEARRVSVPHLVPAALLAGKALQQGGEREVVVLGSEGGDEVAADVMVWLSGRVARWNWWCGSFDGLADSLGKDDGKVRWMGKASGLAEELGRAHLDVDDASGSWLDVAGRAALQLVAEQREPVIDLRRGELAAPDRFAAYRGPVRALALCAVVLLGCVIGVSFWRGGAYAEQATSLRGEQVSVFREAFPDQRVPVSIVARLESEARRLAGVSGQGGESADASELRAASALERLHGLLASLPNNLRFRVLSVNVQKDRLLVEGEARSHGEAEQITSVLRGRGGFEVDPPRTEAMPEGGVSYSFEARPIGGGS